MRGYTVSIFHYYLAHHTDFAKHKALELRGLTFVHDNFGCPKKIKRYIMLHKFFNLNQTTGYMDADVKHKKIVLVQEKLDGSMMRFIRLPNGEVVAKTKLGFNNDQCVRANLFYNKSNNFARFIDWTLDADIAAIFEYTSPFNRIVLRHSEDQIRLLQLRNEDDGTYYNIYESDIVEEYVKLGILELTKKEDEIHALIQYVNEANWMEDFEGWVLTFEDGQMLKIKTKWYLALHRLLTDQVDKENFIVQTVLEDNIDDVIAQLDADDPIRSYVEELSLAIVDYVITQAAKISGLVEKYSKKNNRKAFFMLMANETHANIIMHAYEAHKNGDEILPLIIDGLHKNMLKRCFRLEKAKDFIEKEIGFKTRRLTIWEE